ncbi:protein O-linked glycosyltransferase [Aureococcus anophagefferens]|uniref:Protein O-linked glycosyltransferase n=1 Tax=Aureococcus anophagefferens TaxID=44056 RepID=A0ABR1G1H0_AURAN
MDRPHLWPEVGRFAFSDQAAYDRRAETRNGTCVDWAAVDGRHARRFTVFCNHVAAKVLRRSMQRLMDMAWGRFGGEDLVVYFDATWPDRVPAAKAHLMLFKPCATVKLFLPQILDPTIRWAVYLDTDVVFAADPAALWLGSAAGRALPRAFPDDGANTGVLALDAAAARDAGWVPTLAAVMADLAATKANGSLDLGDQSVFNVAAGGDQFTVARLPCEANFRTDFCQHAAYDCDRCAAAPLLLHAPRSAFHEGKFAYAPAFGRLYAFFLDALDSHDDGAGLAAAAARAAADFERLLDDGRAVARLPCRAIAELALSLVRAAPTR